MINRQSRQKMNELPWLLIDPSLCERTLQQYDQLIQLLRKFSLIEPE
ncbi:hypothetical protein AM1_0517 [Acaryochloris marina MBIC11017]|uniref:Uncharacterized protein n=1 Tax=Acaryochloris marina (strain MBIC 11017) TaxID=329726 RepID=B0CC27_ACAM1|nr:hypothetical protein AM1_0517 [Acaryochloris marina MBIC11017]